MAGSLAGKVALVTGGGWNIGRAVAERFAREGARVVVSSRNRERLEETAAAIRAAGGEALAYPCDVTRRDEVVRLVDHVRSTWDSPTILAALAGGGADAALAPIDEVDPEAWEQVVRTNLFGAVHCVQATLPGMRAAGQGTVVLCSGGGAWFPIVGVPLSAYACAKAALCRLTDQLAVELWDTGIRVNCMEPGLTWSEARLSEVEAEERASGTPHPERAHNHSPDQAAELALFLASDESAPLTARIVATDDDWWRQPEKVEQVCASQHAYCLRRQELTTA